MVRFITKKLVNWKNQPHRKPLILRGARQVGKTWSIIDFGKKYFKGNIHIVDLEKHPEWHGIFDFNLDTRRIVSELEILLNTRIVPNDDLLFFDEIQSCPRAIMSLRYFYEELPELHVIAAGSLLEFVIKDISFPVGRVQFLSLQALCFPEFLISTGKSKLAEIILARPKVQSDIIHKTLLNELRKYLFIGGMPECVNIYNEKGHIHDIFDIQINLLNTFRQDFSKYTPYADKRCLNTVLSSVAKSVGQQIKYTHLSESFSIPTIKKAFDLLSLSQLIKKIASTNPSGLPLGASASERKFKAIMLDVGIMQQVCNIPVDIEYQKTDLLSIYQGALVEQFVGQEFMAAGQNELYYWARNAKSSTAEVDFLITIKNQIFPVEVKSKTSGRLRSLHLFLQTYQNCPYAYVFSCRQYAELPEQKLVFLPLYYSYNIGLRDNSPVNLN
ncbi:MAG: ATP-binding protein [Bacteroidales bacterium]|nr:ATP-binding protein [Bacteroidales bacterium]